MAHHTRLPLRLRNDATTVDDDGIATRDLENQSHHLQEHSQARTLATEETLTTSSH